MTEPLKNVYECNDYLGLLLAPPLAGTNLQTHPLAQKRPQSLKHSENAQQHNKCHVKQHLRKS